MNHGILFKKDNVIPRLRQGYVVVTKDESGRYFTGLVTNDGQLMIHSLDGGQFWGRSPSYRNDFSCGVNRVEASMLLHQTVEGFRVCDIVAIYDSISSWIKDGSLGIL